MYILQSLHSRVPLGTPIDDQTVLRIHIQSKKNIPNAGCGELWLGSATRRCYIPEIDDIENQKDQGSSVCYRATGDIVRRFEDGSIVYEERANDVVKRAGTKISLGMTNVVNVGAY